MKFLRLKPCLNSARPDLPALLNQTGRLANDLLRALPKQSGHFDEIGVVHVIRTWTKQF
jgi:hypothetical protein